MKKTIAILLILLLAFNWFGYRILTGILSDKAEQRLEARLDVSNFDENELIELRIPLNIPYITDQPDFERHYGQAEVDGIYYTYVKRKIENGELVLKCIPNHSKQKIEKAGDEYFKNTNGLANDQQGKKQANAPQFKTGDYDDRIEDFALLSYVSSVKRSFSNLSSLYISHPAHNTPEQPPEAIS